MILTNTAIAVTNFPRSFTSCPGIFATGATVFFIVFYVGITLRDFVAVAPELTQQGTHALPDTADELRLPLPQLVGVSVSYEDYAHGRKRSVDAANGDAYFTLSFTHKTIVEQDRKPRVYAPVPIVDCEVGGSAAVCPASDTTSSEEEGGKGGGKGASGHMLQGTYVKPKYEYVEINVAKCENNTQPADPAAPGTNAAGCAVAEGYGPVPVAGRCHAGPVCAPRAHIDGVIAIGEVKVALTVVVQNFDPEAMHEGGTGVVTSARGWRWPVFEKRKIAAPPRNFPPPPLIF